MQISLEQTADDRVLNTALDYPMTAMIVMSAVACAGFAGAFYAIWRRRRY